MKPTSLITRAVEKVERVRFEFLPGELEAEIPPPSINYNQVRARTKAEYVSTFKRDACLRELPFLMRCGLGPDGALLDYGCGLGRLAYAASKYLGRKGAYFGYEPNQTALAFLRGAYERHSVFTFAGTALPKEEDYVAMQRDGRKAGGTTADKVDLSFVTRPVDVQWSSSVFTHMWIDPIVSVLRQVREHLGPNGVAVNTWLCVDDHAAYALRCGVADRTLPHKIDGAWTNDEANPLACTAYPLETVKEIYARAGHRIEEIKWGSWSGRENGISYQDVVVSRSIDTA